ncbi:hypothetical protein ABPG75_012939 [Micractinium tetrahymenae]
MPRSPAGISWASLASFPAPRCACPLLSPSFDHRSASKLPWLLRGPAEMAPRLPLAVETPDKAAVGLESTSGSPNFAISAQAVGSGAGLHAPLLTGDHSPHSPNAPSSPPPASQPEPPGGPRELQGLMLNALATVFGAGMSLFAKISGSHGISVFEIVLTRSLILVAFTGPDLLHRRCNPFADPRRRWLLVLRGVLGFLAVTFLYLAVGLLPLADASVLSFLSPIFVAALSPFILGERSSRGTLLGIPIAMVGVLLVAQPSFLFGRRGGGGISLVGVLVGVCQALFNSLSRMTVRALSVGSKEPISSIIFGQGAISTLGAVLMCTATSGFKLPGGPSVWGSLLAGGLLGYLYQLALTGGLQRARAAPAVAMSYLSILWSMLADIWVFKRHPNALSVLGTAIICGSSFFVAFSQKRQAAAAKRPAPVDATNASTSAGQQLQLQQQEQELAAAMATQAGHAEWREEEQEGRPLLGGSAAAHSSPARAESGTSAWSTLLRTLASWRPAGIGGSRHGSTLSAVRAVQSPARRLSQGA